MERILNFKIFAIVFLVLSLSAFGLEDCNSQNYLLLELEYKNGLVTYLGHSTEVGCVPGALKTGDFKIEVFDKETLVYSSMFQDPSKLFVDVGYENKITGGIINVDKKKFYLAAPAVSEAKVKIYNKEVQIMSAEVKSSKNIVRGKSVGLFSWVEDLLREVSALLR